MTTNLQQLLQDRLNQISNPAAFAGNELMRLPYDQKIWDSTDTLKMALKKVPLEAVHQALTFILPLLALAIGLIFYFNQPFHILMTTLIGLHLGYLNHKYLGAKVKKLMNEIPYHEKRRAELTALIGSETQTNPDGITYYDVEVLNQIFLLRHRASFKPFKKSAKHNEQTRARCIKHLRNSVGGLKLAHYGTSFAQSEPAPTMRSFGTPVSANHPAANIAGTPMMTNLFDIYGNPYGIDPIQDINHQPQIDDAHMGHDTQPAMSFMDQNPAPIYGFNDHDGVPGYDHNH